MGSKAPLTKICTKCHIEKSIINFSKMETGKYGVKSICKTCISLNRRKYPKIIVPEGTKICNVCHNLKSIEDFHKRRKNKLNIRSICKECKNKEGIKYYSKNITRMRKYYANAQQQTKYGITLEEKKKICEHQDWKCQICKEKLNKENINSNHTDHNHQTGKIRSILCKDCNHILIYKKDHDVEIHILESSILYLNKIESIYNYYTTWKRHHKKEFQELLNQCNNKCEICRSEFINENNTTYPHIDHNKKTGKIRGVLCHRCNIRLGNARDNILILRSCINYLKEYNYSNSNS